MAKDINNKRIKVGSHVIWYDPEVECRDLTRVYEVFDISDDMVCIADDYSEAEVYASELEVVDK
jgi:hypothetical protein